MRYFRTIVGMLAVIGCMGIGLLVWQLNAPNPKRLAEQPVSEDQGGPPAHPLMIEAIRMRDYPGSAIKTEQNLGNQGGYTNQVISYRSDGLKIFALMSVPVSPRPAKGYPVVVLNHGFIPADQYSTTGPDYVAWISHLARNGFVVIKPDYRGHGNSEGTAEGGNFSPVYAYDILNLVASLKKYDLVDPEGIGMIGHSMGGSVSLRTIVVSKDVKATVMAAGTVGSAEDLMYRWRRRTTTPPPQFINSVRRRLTEEFGEPKSNPEFWNKVSAVNYVDFVAGAVQIHHGSDDDSVPPLFSETLNTALEKAQKDVDHFVYPGGDHNFTVHRSQYLQRITNFFTRELR